MASKDKEKEVGLTEADWEEAYEHLFDMEQSYLEQMGIPGVNVANFFNVRLPSIRGRWNRGIRDEQLYDDIMRLK